MVIYFSLEFARLSSRGTTNLLTLLSSENFIEIHVYPCLKEPKTPHYPNMIMMLTISVSLRDSHSAKAINSNFEE